MVFPVLNFLGKERKMIKEKVTIKNETGLHARPASELVKLASKFKCNINIAVGDKNANAKSILAIMSLGVKVNTEIELQCDGEDEETAIKEIIEAINNKFGE